MAYSYWRDSFWYTDSRNTHVTHIDATHLFISPRKGEQLTLTYKQVRELDPDINWVAKTFPYAPTNTLMELLFFIHAFKADMESMFKWHGWKTFALYESAVM